MQWVLRKKCAPNYRLQWGAPYFVISEPENRTKSQDFLLCSSFHSKVKNILKKKLKNTKKKKHKLLFHRSKFNKLDIYLFGKVIVCWTIVILYESHKLNLFFFHFLKTRPKILIKSPAGIIYFEINTIDV